MNTLNEKVLRNSNEFRRQEPKRNQSIIWRLMVGLIDLIYLRIRIAVIQIDKNVIWDWLEALMENTGEGKPSPKDKNESITKDQIPSSESFQSNPNPILYI